MNLNEAVEVFCPSIKELDHVKRGILLSLATTPQEPVHVLLVGVPACGKSELIRDLSYFINGAVFATPKSTASGLTMNGRTGEAGSLLLANNSILCLDELDKFTKADISCLLEALDNQKVTINTSRYKGQYKAEFICFATCNNIKKLPEELISRFGLVFKIPEYNEDNLENIINYSLSNPDRDTGYHNHLKETINELWKHKLGFNWNEVKDTTVIQDMKDIILQSRMGDNIRKDPRLVRDTIRLGKAFARWNGRTIVIKEDLVGSVSTIKKALDLKNSCNDEDKVIGFLNMPKTELERSERWNSVLPLLLKPYSTGNHCEEYGDSEIKIHMRYYFQKIAQTMGFSNEGYGTTNWFLKFYENMLAYYPTPEQAIALIARASQLSKELLVLNPMKGIDWNAVWEKYLGNVEDRLQQLGEQYNKKVFCVERKSDGWEVHLEDGRKIKVSDDYDFEERLKVGSGEAV